MTFNDKVNCENSNNQNICVICIIIVILHVHALQYAGGGVYPAMLV